MNATRIDTVGDDGGQAGEGRAVFTAMLAVCVLGAAAAGFLYGVPAAAALSRFWIEVMLPVFITLYLNGVALCA